jgi:hypothetical protein
VNSWLFQLVVVLPRESVLCPDLVRVVAQGRLAAAGQRPMHVVAGIAPVAVAQERRGLVHPRPVALGPAAGVRPRPEERRFGAAVGEEVRRDQPHDCHRRSGEQEQGHRVAVWEARGCRGAGGDRHEHDRQPPPVGRRQRTQLLAAQLTDRL